MTSIKKRQYEIYTENKGVHFRVLFDDVQDAFHAIEDLSIIMAAYDAKSTINRLRTLCQSTDGIVYSPKSDIKLPKARWVTVAAAASFPNGVPKTLVYDSIDITPSTLSAYCTSENNPTSQFLRIEGESIYISPDGIEWLRKLLEKDKQLPIGE